MRSLPILLTRPRAASEAVGARLTAAGAGRIEIAPLLEIALVDALPDLAEGLIFTSRNGVAAYVALGGPPGLSTWCVGPKTAQEAAAHGLTVQGVASEASTLAAAIPEGAPPLLHLRGAHQRGDLVGDLRSRGRQGTDAVIYDQVALPLTEAAKALVAAGPVLAPLYSPRTAHLLWEALNPSVQGHVQAVCLSQAVADAAPFPCRAIAETPDGPAMERAILETLRAIGG